MKFNESDIKDIHFEELEEHHICGDYLNMLNDPEVNKFMTTKHITKLELKRWVINKKLSTTDFGYAIFYKTKFCGTITISEVNFDNNNGRFGIMIDKRLHSTGFGTLIINLFKDLVKEKLGITKMWLKVDPDNVGAVKCYEKVGFKHKYIEMELE